MPIGALTPVMDEIARCVRSGVFYRVGVVFIRDACSEDVPLIAELHRHSAAVAYHGIIPIEAPTPALSTLESEWHGAIADELTSVLVAHDGSLLIGVVVVRADPDHGGGSQLRRLYVDPEQWRHGIGGQLHDAALATAQARGFRTISLWVLEHNARARRFYETRAWKLIADERLEWPQLGIIEVRYELEL